MARKSSIDRDWFYQKLTSRGETISGLGRFLNIDKSAASRMLAGERKMSAEEQDLIAQFLGVSIVDIAAHRTISQQGFKEMKQPDFTYGHMSSPDMEAGRPAASDEKAHPIFGCMKGTMTIAADLDLTAPIDVEWSDKLYNE
ncbi:helix-turn-helix transcriptional regulator [Rhizobium sp. CB3090]|uniref:helix-turn-helix domain-containing protein n=1 Tax=Rhizobium sp. CB3090 TaxID=3039156 RepID=UPI0024B241F3|nr:helix-turn-helix transcriptional regulator [Rhizobium sp. CB3090]WFU07595.1 helix-turn-helix transcriptional regulator [Rhizobium sp. CB3090]